jgi:hypothetical protein
MLTMPMYSGIQWDMRPNASFAACMRRLAAHRRNHQPDILLPSACHHLASATIAASSLLASAFTSGAAAEGGAAIAGVGAAMTASAACSPASFTEGVLALQDKQPDKHL